jgi:anti-sigma regulatory factor (Ser/Thr protein kinase)
MARHALTDVRGRLDGAGRLIEADPALEALQREAGAAIGDVLAIPQLAAIARLALELGAEVSRPALAASASEDIEMWVKALPADGGLTLVLDDWRPRPPGGSRLEPLLAGDGFPDAQPVRLEWTADEQLRLIAISSDLARIFGVEAETVAGLPLTRLVQLEENDDGDMPLIEALALRHDFDGQKGRSRNGDGVSLTLSGRVVTATDGSFAGFRGDVIMAVAPGAGDDPTVSTDPAGFDHALDDVLREPLERIIESAGRIVERADGPLRGDYASYGGDIAAAARHLSSVIRDMGDSLTSERSEANRPVDLTALAAEALVMVEPSAEERSIDIQLEDRQPLVASGQERAIIQILVNLLGNAVRHSNEGESVDISFSETAASASLTVRDHGRGIAMADQQRIFERYEQVEQGGGSAGLGLAISRRLARAMGGDISVYSAPGEGAAFTLTLPTA